MTGNIYLVHDSIHLSLEQISDILMVYYLNHQSKRRNIVDFLTKVYILLEKYIKSMDFHLIIAVYSGSLSMPN